MKRERRAGAGLTFGLSEQLFLSGGVEHLMVDDPDEDAATGSARTGR